MPEEKSGYVYFEGIIPEKKDKKGELAITDAAYLIQFEIPNELTGKEVWIPKSQIIDPIQDIDSIRGKVARWLLEKNFNFEMKEVEVTIEAVNKAAHEAIESAQVEVIQPIKEVPVLVKEMKAEYEMFVGDNPLINKLEDLNHSLKCIDGTLLLLIEFLKEYGPTFGRGF